MLSHMNGVCDSMCNVFVGMLMWDLSYIYDLFRVLIVIRYFYLLLVDTFRFLESIEYVFVNASEALTGSTAVADLLYVTTICVSFNRNEKRK